MKVGSRHLNPTRLATEGLDLPVEDSTWRSGTGVPCYVSTAKLQPDARPQAHTPEAVTSLWNSLPSEVVEERNEECFKRRLDEQLVRRW
ncbi:unnamed protein product [Echinostoma caproni]|uniref:Uncharacterized protein n=1 Tax=Echinostoma caproni TaxID=27848 RepID=A0A183A198_9TREM|nr:unnamed protein product [Echinostoma caproni]